MQLEDNEMHSIPTIEKEQREPSLAKPQNDHWKEVVIAPSARGKSFLGLDPELKGSVGRDAGHTPGAAAGDGSLVGKFIYIDRGQSFAEMVDDFRNPCFTSNQVQGDQ